MDLESPEIPKLEKDEKKKRRGFGLPFWGSSSKGAGAFIGGGSRATSWIALWGLRAGIVALTAGIGGLLAGHYGLLGSRASGEKIFGKVDPIASSVAVRRPSGQGSSLDFASRGSKGVIKWDQDEVRASSEPEPPEPVEEKPDPAAEAAEAAKAAAEQAQQLPGGLSSAKLSNALGQSAFGKNDIFGGGAPGAKLGLNKDFLQNRPMNMGNKLAKFTPNKMKASVRNLGARGRVGADRSSKQLGAAREFSSRAAGMDGAPSSWEANRAFEGRTSGDALGIGVGDGEAPSVPGANPAPDAPTTPNPGLGENVTPYDLDDSWADKLASAKKLMILGAILIAVGIALMFFAPAIGAALIAIGGILLLIGYMMYQNAKAEIEKAAAQMQEQQEQLSNQVVDNVDSGAAPNSNLPEIAPPPTDVHQNTQQMQQNMDNAPRQ